MKRFAHPWGAALALALGLFALGAAPAYAYIDPGTGSVIWQALIAGGLGLLFVLKSYGRRIWRALGHRSPTHGDSDERDG